MILTADEISALLERMDRSSKGFSKLERTLAQTAIEAQRQRGELEEQCNERNNANALLDLRIAGLEAENDRLYGDMDCDPELIAKNAKLTAENKRLREGCCYVDPCQHRAGYRAALTEGET